jgi:hypothetical protein
MATNKPDDRINSSSGNNRSSFIDDGSSVGSFSPNQVIILNNYFFIL